MLGRFIAVCCLGQALVSGVARADSRPIEPALVGATATAELTVPSGFVDDPIASDAGRIAYVAADASTLAQLHVVTLATKQDVTADLAAITLHPTAIALFGHRAVVIGVRDDGQAVAGAVELTDGGKAHPIGSIVYKLGPATHITVVQRDGSPRLAVERDTPIANGGTRHEAELDSIETGKPVAKGRPLDLDGDGQSTALGLRVNHWGEGWTHAYGIKAGEWTRAADMKLPDGEGNYDLITNKLDKTAITDLFEQRRRFQTLADANGALDFVRFAWDNSGIWAWRAGKAHPLTLDEPLPHYDAKSLQGVVLPDGSAWLALQIDPVNADAVERKKADPEYLDIFFATPDGHATRKMRVAASGLRFRFGVAGDQLWLIERNHGFERGGSKLTLYKPD